MPNRRFRIARPRWLPHTTLIVLGSAATLCYREYALVRDEFAPQNAPSPTPTVGIPEPLPAPTATPRPRTTPTPRPSATPVLRTPPLIARAERPAEASAPEPQSAPFAGGGLVPERRKLQAIDFGDAPSTSTPEPPREEPKRAPRQGSRPEKTQEPAPREAKAQVGGIEIHSEASSSRVAAVFTREPEAAQPAENAEQPVQNVEQQTQTAPQDAQIAQQQTQDVARPAQNSQQQTQNTPPDAQEVPQPTQVAPQPVQIVPQPTQTAPQPAQEAQDEASVEAKAREGISSRATTSDTNILSPLPASARLPEPSVAAPLPSLTGALFNTVPSTEGTTRRGPEPSLAPVGIPPGPRIASGDEGSGGNFSLTSDTPIVTDLERGISLAQGNVVLSYGAFRATGKRGVAYLNASPRIATLSDDLVITAKVRGREQTFRGESLSFNLDTGRWELSGLRATFPPNLFPQGQVLEPLFLRDARVFGRDENADASDLAFSSCDEDHYFLQSKALNFYRDARGNPDRVVLRKNALYVFGKKILPLPTYTYDLQGQRSRRNSLVPNVGRNEIDGFFAKTTYELGATPSRTDSMLIDALEKRGLGLGFQRELANGAGLFHLYAVSGKGVTASTGNAGGREVNARLRRDFSIGQSLRSSFSFDSSQNNGLMGSGFSNANGALSLDYQPSSGTASGSLQLTTNSTRNPFNTLSQRSGTLNLQREFAGAWNASLSSQYNTSTSTLLDPALGAGIGDDKQETLDSTLGLTRSFSRFDAALEAELHDDLTGTLQKNGAYQLERLPELQLTSDTRRLTGGVLDRLLPGRVRLSLGSFNEPATEQKLGRTRLEYVANQRSLKLVQKAGLRSRFDIGGGFVQSVYGDDTARYDTTADVTFLTDVGRERRVRGGQSAPIFQFRTNYRKLRPTGYTPFQFDFLAPNEFVDVRGILQPTSRARLELAGGRDIQAGISRPVTGTLRLLPTRALSFDFSAAYALEEGEFNDFNSNILLNRSRNRFLGGTIQLGVRYSPRDSLFSSINAAADVQLGKKTQLQAFSIYNGFSKQFEVNQFRIVRDLHCFNLYASYDAQRRQVRLDLALKAFPFVDSRLGQSVLGEGFDPAIGTVR